MARACARDRPWNGRSETITTSAPAAPAAPATEHVPLTGAAFPAGVLAFAGEASASDTQASPPGAAATAREPAAGGGGSSRPVTGSMRTTIVSAPFTTQTAFAPTVTAAAPIPASIVRITRRGGPSWMRQTTPSTGSVTQSAPAPAAMPLRLSAGTGMRRVTRPVRGSMRRTVLSVVTTQSAPIP